MNGTLEERLIRKSGTHLATLLAKGFDLSTTDDFEEAQRVLEAIPKGSITPMFDIVRNDFTRSDAIWNFLTKDGEVVGCSAARIYRLKGESISDFLARTSKRQYNLTDPVFDNFAVPLKEDLSGNVIYLGELEICEAARGDVSVLVAFVRLLQALAAIRWIDEFDAMFAFLTKDHLKLSRLYGFATAYEAPIAWREPPAGRLNSHAVIVNRRSQFEHIWSA